MPGRSKPARRGRAGASSVPQPPDRARQPSSFSSRSRPNFTVCGPLHCSAMNATSTCPARRIDPHRRFRQPGDARSSHSRVREAGVYSEIVPFSRALEGYERIPAERHHPLGRSRLGDAGGQPARRSGTVEAGRADARHLLRQQLMPSSLAGRSSPATIASSAGRSSRSRTNARSSRAWSAREATGLDEPRRQVDALPPGFRIVAQSDGALRASATRSGGCTESSSTPRSSTRRTARG